MKKYLIAILITGFSSSVFATDKLGFYAGLGFSGAYFEADPFNDVSLGAHGELGYRHSPNLALEGSIGGSELMDLDSTAYSVAISVLPMVPVGEDTDAFIRFTYAITTSSDWPESNQHIEDGFGVGIGFMHHIDRVYMRASLGTAFNDEVEGVGINLGIGFKF